MRNTLMLTIALLLAPLSEGADQITKIFTQK